MKTFAFYFIQLTWGLAVNLFGGILYLIYRLKGCRKERFCNALVTYTPGKESLYAWSLGLFLFAAVKKGDPPEKTWSREILAHEYGHTCQVLVLGPLYWLVIALPSAIWLRGFAETRRRRNVSYYDFYTEAWANRLGAAFTGLKNTVRWPILTCKPYDNFAFFPLFRYK